MSSSWQTIASLLIVAFAAGWLVWRALTKRHESGCGGEACGAISPDIRALHKKLKKE
jgi:ABC-type nickel/cobalt efflux system permease component RcnA